MSLLARHINRTMVAWVAAGVLLIAGSVLAQDSVKVAHVTAFRGSSGVSVPISLVKVEADEIFAVEVFLTYDSTLIFEGLRYEDAQQNPTLLNSWYVDTTGDLENLEDYLDKNFVTDGPVDTLKIAGATISHPLPNGGVLFYLDFTIPDERDPRALPIELAYVVLNADTPAVVPVDGSITLTGTDGSITAPAFLARDLEVEITVTDIDEDRDSLAVDSVPVRVTVGAQQENFVAVESDISTGSFNGSISTVFSAAISSGDGVIQVQNGDQIIFCYDDLLDASGGTVERCATSELLLGTLGAIETTVVVQPTDTLRIRVEDEDLNIDPAVKDTISVTVTSRDDETGAQKDEEMILLQETDVDTDLFFGEAVTVNGEGIAGDLILRIDLADTLFISYFDAAAGDLGQVDLMDTCVVVDPWGDASANQKLGGQDAFLILSHSVGETTLVGLDSLAANVDLLSPGSPIEAADASLVLRRRVGLIDHFPVQEKTSANHPQPDGGGAPKPASVARIIALETRAGYLAVVVEERDGIVAGELTLRGFHGRVAMAGELADFLVVSRRDEEITRIAFAGVEPVSGAGELLLLSPMNADRVELESARFNGGRIVGQLASPAPASLPPAFELRPNVPNPFNPETLIRYALPRAGRVDLEIFNVAGQQVRTLVHGNERAGNHQVLWDGSDDGGAKVSAGVYFYRLKTGDFQSVRKMVLVK